MIGLPNPWIAATIAAAGFGAGLTIGLKWDAGTLARCEAVRDKTKAALRDQSSRVEELARDGDLARKQAQEAQEQAQAAEDRAKAAEQPKRAAIAAGTGPATCFGAIEAARAGLKP
jgi:outer membrane murein-binding lipoprotein Lpp